MWGGVVGGWVGVCVGALDSAKGRNRGEGVRAGRRGTDGTDVPQPTLRCGGRSRRRGIAGWRSNARRTGRRSVRGEFRPCCCRKCSNSIAGGEKRGTAGTGGMNRGRHAPRQPAAADGGGATVPTYAFKDVVHNLLSKALQRNRLAFHTAVLADDANGRALWADALDALLHVRGVHIELHPVDAFGSIWAGHAILPPVRGANGVVPVRVALVGHKADASVKEALGKATSGEEASARRTRWGWGTTRRRTGGAATGCRAMQDCSHLRLVDRGLEAAPVARLVGHVDSLVAQYTGDLSLRGVGDLRPHLRKAGACGGQS